MMKKRLWMVFRGCAVFGFFALLSQSGYAGVTVDLYGGGLITNPTSSALIDRKVVAYPSGGLTLNIPLAKVLDFQVSSLYITRKIDIAGIQLKNKLLGGQLGFRLKPLSFLSLSGGAYVNHRLDNPLLVQGQEWGGYGGVSLAIPLGQSVRLLLQSQYHYVSRSLNFPAGKYVPDELFAFVGFSFGRESRY